MAKNYLNYRIIFDRPQGPLSVDTERDDGILRPVKPGGRGAASKMPQKKVHLKCYGPSKKLHRGLAYPEAVTAWCDFPSCVEDEKAAAVLFLLTLISQVAHLLVGVTTGLPLLQLSCKPTAVYRVIHTLLCAFQGPEWWDGDNWTLLRPWFLRPHLAAGNTMLSADILSYIGGKIKLKKKYTCSLKKHKFWVPYACGSLALMPELPVAVTKELLDLSPLALPIVFETPRCKTERPKLDLKCCSLELYDQVMLEDLKRLGPTFYIALSKFLRWFCAKRKRIKCWEAEISCFRPIVRSGRFQQVKTGDEVELLSAAMALFKWFLYFASEKKGWIPQEQAGECLLRYWRLVLPESAPHADNGQAASTSIVYDAPEVFYRFFMDNYLPTYRRQIIRAIKGGEETMGLIRELNGEMFFITPRESILKAYSEWLPDHSRIGLDCKSGATVQRCLKENGVPLKGEKRNPATWRYAFRSNGEKIECFALPLAQLPESVQHVFDELFGTDSGCEGMPEASDAVPNSAKEVE